MGLIHVGVGSLEKYATVWKGVRGMFQVSVPRLDLQGA